MKHTSIWEYSKHNSINNQDFKNIKTDILIIGAGITGLTTAYFLKDLNKKITIIDKSQIGSGITAKTTAKITYLQQDIYRKLIKIYGKKTAQKYYKSQKEAIDLITKIIKENKINCDLEKVTSILFSNSESNKIEEEKNILSTYGENPKPYKDNFINYGFTVDNTYVFNPIKYLNSLKKIIEKNITIYENTIATSIQKLNDLYIVNTNKGIIKSNIVVLACHYPFFIIPGFFPLKTYIEREYVCATKVDNHKKITAINTNNNLYSLRYYKNYLIFGSNDHRLTNKMDYGQNYQKSKEDFIKYFHKEPEYVWMNQDIISNDSLPFIGKIKNNLYISTSYNTWGMTNATIGSKIIADLINEKENEYTYLFNPKRITIPLVLNSFIGVFHYLKAYLESLFRRNNPYYIKIKGLIYGIYIDDNGIKHKVKLLCPHMKCLLVFNNEEKTWDCPCHGSRFDLDGNIINTPSVKEISLTNHD